MKKVIKNNLHYLKRMIRIKLFIHNYFRNNLFISKTIRYKLNKKYH